MIVWCHMKGLLMGNGGANLDFSWWPVFDFACSVIDGSSSMFVFISGFLFYQVFYVRGFEYRRFMISKFKKVFLPFFIATTAFAAWRLLRGHGSITDANFMYFGCYWYWSNWYIWFIMIMFAIAPLHIMFVESTERQKIVVMVISIIFAMGFGRHNLNAFLSVLFWNSIYLFGIYCAIHLEDLKKLDFNGRACLFAVTLLYMAWMASDPGKSWIVDSPPREVTYFQKISWILPGKLLQDVCLLYIFAWFKDHGWKFLRKFMDVLATYAFSIYFLHNFIILHLERRPHKSFFSSMNFYEIQLSAFVIAIIACILCIMVAWPIKKLTGKYSRMIIGS